MNSKEEEKKRSRGQETQLGDLDQDKQSEGLGWRHGMCLEIRVGAQDRVQ